MLSPADSRVEDFHQIQDVLVDFRPRGPAQVEEIAKLKMPDLNAVDLKGAIRIIEGTARSMGIQIA